MAAALDDALDLISLADSAEPAEGEVEEMPLFPLGVAYVPGTVQSLNIFEARYKEMLNDMLLSGRRRFAVCTDTKNGESEGGDERFARVAVEFAVKECDVRDGLAPDGSRGYEVTCNVLRRVRVKSVRNPDAWASKRTYLRADVEPWEDLDEGRDCALLEDRARAALQAVLRRQPEDAPGLRESVLDDFTFDRDGFWKLVDLWQDFQSHKLCYQRAMANSEMVKMLMKYVEANRDAATQQDNEIKLEIDSLPPNIQYEVKQFQERTSEGIEEFRKRALFRIQELVQSRSHEERLRMLTETFEQEEMELAGQSALRNVFKELDLEALDFD
jgi:hypothetical protein